MVYRRLLLAILLLLSLVFLLSSCGTKLGEIRPEQVNMTLADAQKAIDEAKRLGAEEHARDQLLRAEVLLSQSREALARKEGAKAIDLAYRSMAEAKAAGTTAWRIEKQKEEAEQALRNKERELEITKEQLRIAQEEINRSRNDIRDLANRLSQIEQGQQREINLAREAKLEAERREKEALREFERAREELNRLREELQAAKESMRRGESRSAEEVERLRRELEETQRELEEARRQAEESKVQARKQAVGYSSKIGALERQKARERAIADAREYVAKQQEEETPAGTIPTDEIDQAKSFVESWYLDWDGGNLAQHLLRYSSDAVFSKYVIRGSKEDRQEMSRSQFESELRKQSELDWKLDVSSKSFDEKTGSGRYPLVRELEKRPGTEKLVDVWIRQPYVRKVGSQWKIVKEIWKIYEAVPGYSAGR